MILYKLNSAKDTVITPIEYFWSNFKFLFSSVFVTSLNIRILIKNMKKDQLIRVAKYGFRLELFISMV